MGKIDNFMRAIKLEKLLLHAHPENHDELSNMFDDIYSTQFASRHGMYVVDDLGEIMKAMALEKDKARVIDAVKDYVQSQSGDAWLYATIRDFLFKFAKNGPELYEALEAGNITPEKQWEIDLKKRENFILEGNEKDEVVREELVSQLAKTQTPISVHEIRALGESAKDIVMEIKEMMYDAVKELVEKEGLDPKEVDNVLENAMKNPDIIGFTIKQNEKGEYELHGVGMLEGFVTNALNLRDIDLHQLAYITENAMTRFKYSGDISDTMSLTKSQVELTLNTYIKVAQKYQGMDRFKEREYIPEKDTRKKELNPLLKYKNIDYEKNLNNKEFGDDIINYPDKEYNLKEGNDVLDNELPQVKGPYINTPSGPYIEESIGSIIERPDITEIGDGFDLDEISLPSIKPKRDGEIVMQNDLPEREL